MPGHGKCGSIFAARSKEQEPDHERYPRAQSTQPVAAFEVHLTNFLTVEYGLTTRDDAYYDAKGRPVRLTA